MAQNLKVTITADTKNAEVNLNKTSKESEKLGQEIKKTQSFFNSFAQTLRKRKTI